MLIYLLRHAVAAKPAELKVPVQPQQNDVPSVDADRPLTKDGRKKMTLAARGIERIISAPIGMILTSPYTRAVETARITAAELGAEKKVKLCPELIPGTSHEKLLTAITKYKTRKNILLVGHAPDLNSTVSALLGSESLTVEMKKGALCCIELSTLSAGAKGKLLWLLQPKQLRQLAQ